MHVRCAADLVRHAVGPGHRNGQSARPAGRARRPECDERVRITHVIAERDHRRRPKFGQQELERLAFATGRTGTEVDDEAPTVVDQVVRREVPLDCLDGGLDLRAC